MHVYMLSIPLIGWKTTCLLACLLTTLAPFRWKLVSFRPGVVRLPLTRESILFRTALLVLGVSLFRAGSIGVYLPTRLELSSLSSPSLSSSLYTFNTSVVTTFFSITGTAAPLVGVGVGEGGGAVVEATVGGGCCGTTEASACPSRRRALDLISMSFTWSNSAVHQSDTWSLAGVMLRDSFFKSSVHDRSMSSSSNRRYSRVVLDFSDSGAGT